MQAHAGRLPGRAVKVAGKLRDKLIQSLPFKLTGAQLRALAEIGGDMASPHRMLRLLQGDVGSGKTVVALIAMLDAVEAGGQAALMAPTEILARQHFATLDHAGAKMWVSRSRCSRGAKRAARARTSWRGWKRARSGF